MTLSSGSNHDPSPKFMCVLSHFIHVQLCDPMDCSLPGSSVHGILLAGILEWVVLPSSRGSSQPRDGTHISCDCRQILYCWVTHTKSQNVNLFGNRVFADVFSWGSWHEVILDLGGELNPMTSFLIRRWEDTERHTERKAMGGERQSWAKEHKDASNHQKLEKSRKGPPLKPLEGG